MFGGGRTSPLSVVPNRKGKKKGCISPKEEDKEKYNKLLLPLSGKKEDALSNALLLVQRARGKNVQLKFR